MDTTPDPGPTLGVSVLVDRHVFRALSAGGADQRAGHLIAGGVASTMEELGMPGRPVVEVGAAHVHGGDARIEFRIDGRASVFPLAIRYAIGRIHGEPARGTETLSAEALVDAVSMAAVEVIRRRPGLLLGRDQISAYRHLLALDQTAGVPTSDEWLRAVIAPVLGLGISISELDRARRVVLTGWEQGRPPEDLAEDLIETFAPETIEIHLPTEDLRALTLGAGEQDRSEFPNVRADLLRQLGGRFPPFTFVRGEHLPTATFAFRLNHVTSSLWHGLGPRELFVSAPPYPDTAKRPLLSPTDGSGGIVVDGQASDQLRSFGSPFYTPTAYVAACLLHELRARAHWYIRGSVVASQLEDAALVFPELARAVRRRFSDEQIARVLRELLREDVSIRDTEWILERLLAFDSAQVNSIRRVVVNDVLPVLHRSDAAADPDALAAFVRAGLYRPLVERLGTLQTAMKAYVLDPGLEEDLVGRILSAANPAEEATEAFGVKVREAIFETADGTASSPPLPLLVSSFEVRSFLRDLVPLEWVRLPIISRMELPRNLDVDQVGVVSVREDT